MMRYKIIVQLFFVSIVILLVISCLHSKTTAPTAAASNSIIINSGKAILKINGKINENLYLEYTYHKPARDDDDVEISVLNIWKRTKTSYKRYKQNGGFSCFSKQIKK